jgi:hypothetical protein
VAHYRNVAWPTDATMPQFIRDPQERASVLAPAAPCRQRFATLASPLRQLGESSSNRIVPVILGSVQEIRVVPEIVATKQAPTPGEPHNLVGGRVSELDEALKQFLA